MNGASVIVSFRPIPHYSGWQMHNKMSSLCLFSVCTYKNMILSGSNVDYQQTQYSPYV